MTDIQQEENGLLAGDDLDSLFSDVAMEPEVAAAPQDTRDLDYFQQLPVKVTLEVASAEVSLGELMEAGEGAVIELNKAVGEPLDVKVNGALLAQGEVVVANGRYGVRLTRIVNRPASQAGANET
ncbi:flagellar motor switch protein FliN [Oceanimonas baumannii]|uniref:Flagellar motor switch protein FliN n=1 Tax=Oceanimonas baumannii TaxID=129578 RepID=A0A235CPG9_9GAMM|nr:flagellar motor switch protein FliN [Oceanimonas baumannii]OYD25765.1 flagellar motor switch protein FliN [Oceanimonas baumannii]TDW60228.1 flagellar motor switch protein FliN/FliY [Oceanimonas baumannii]